MTLMHWCTYSAGFLALLAQVWMMSENFRGACLLQALHLPSFSALASAAQAESSSHWVYCASRASQLQLWRSQLCVCACCCITSGLRYRQNLDPSFFLCFLSSSQLKFVCPSECQTHHLLASSCARQSAQLLSRSNLVKDQVNYMYSSYLWHYFWKVSICLFFLCYVGMKLLDDGL